MNHLIFAILIFWFVFLPLFAMALCLVGKRFPGDGDSRTTFKSDAIRTTHPTTAAMQVAGKNLNAGRTQRLNSKAVQADLTGAIRSGQTVRSAESYRSERPSASTTLDQRLALESVAQTEQCKATAQGIAPKARVQHSISWCSAAWKRVRFGAGRASVQIRPSGPFPKTTPALGRRLKGRIANILAGGDVEIGMSAELVGDYAKAVKLLEATSSIVQMNLVGKDQQIEIRIPAVPNFYGLLMQCTLQEGVDYQPEFLGIIKDLPKSEEKPEQATEAAP